MPFFIEDIFLRMLGLSIPPFDMIWLIETIGDYVENVRREETQQKLNNKIKEIRLLYELGEITKHQYERRNEELNQQRQICNKINRMNLNQRINILG